MTHKDQYRQAKAGLLRWLLQEGIIKGKRPKMKAKTIRKLVRKHDPCFTGGKSYWDADDFVIAYHQDLKRRHALPKNVPALRKYRKGVYIIGNRKYGFCKIGFSRRAEKRLKELQTACPFELSVLAHFVGKERDFESTLHKRAAPYREQGEWFRIEGRLKAFLDKH